MNRRAKARARGGFTLVELIVVIAILAILMALLVPTMTGVIADAKQQVYDGNARTVYSALKAAVAMYLAQGNEPYPLHDAHTNKFAFGGVVDPVWAIAEGYLGADFLSGTDDIAFSIDAQGGVGGVTWTGTEEGAQGHYPQQTD